MRRSYSQPNERTVQRALMRLTRPDAVLARDPHGHGYGVFYNGDRRRRPMVRITEAQAQALVAEGAVAADGDAHAFKLTSAGAAHAARVVARPNETYQAQHAPVIDRPVIDADGDVRQARGYAPFTTLVRLVRLKNADGTPWLAPEELDAARRLRGDWDAGQIGLVRGADWAAPPQSRQARGPGNGRETALAIGLDARARVEEALAALAPPLKRVAIALLLHDCGLEDFERAQGWPTRSAKIALKLALAQLAAGRSGGRL